MTNSFKVLTSSISNQWMTPEYILEMVREFFGGSIGLDPASSPIAQAWVRADEYFSPEKLNPDGSQQDGMQMDWHCETCWLNPPYGKTNKKLGVYGAGAWLTRLREQYLLGHIRKEALTLVRGDSEGLKTLVRECYYIECDRIAFVNPEDFEKNNPVPNSKLFYLGHRETEFIKTFSCLGIPMRAVDLSLLNP